MTSPKHEYVNNVSTCRIALRYGRLLSLACAFFLSQSCSQKSHAPPLADERTESLSSTAVLPLSDPANQGEWVYNTEVSDEFNGDTIDEDRWYIVGKFENGKPVYKHPDNPKKWVWKGRAPSQFSGRNYRLEEGKLVLETRWEPDFPFSDEVRKPHFGDPLPYENITTACFISRKFFTYGYIEIRSKAADAEVTSAFWSMGNKIELDFFEQFGDHRDPEKNHLDRELWWSLRDWQTGLPDAGKPVFTQHKDLGFRVADDFHVYGFEWDESGFKYYVDGKLISEVSKDDVRKWALENRNVPEDYDGWVADRPISLWLDQETFPWHGVPDSLEDLEKNSPEGEKEDGVVDFEIDYVRVWQKPRHLEQEPN
ncbi:family 16 glycosylhydrolase [Aestuariibacter sp. A3R04]|uniref:family 16 glycosylhydrolase n=1 Tax=Aestuariibacter sp. A3R04 TaxID=2841571 RepID=UPI001C098F4C|nr:family 16 glycosylhydrolase [Aestuariibacter sp. A3R04]MBU3021356.1 family 16 glycosylhydrolase [Aestuariibacter sp. A3R04]